MARTSENGEAESSAGAAGEKWIARDGIKQEIMIELDQSSSSKDWSFTSPLPGTEITNSNEIVQDTVLFGSNITNPVNKEKIEKLLDNATNVASKKTVSNLLLEIEKLSDMERLLLYFKLPLDRSSDVDPLRMPLNPLGSRPEIMQTVVWIQTHLEEDVEVSLPKQEVYEEYGSYCEENAIKPLSTADFGKVMKQVFPNVRPRRLGTRGHSRYCYSGLRKKGELSAPVLADLYCDNGKIYEPDPTTERASSLVREWAEKLLGINSGNMSDLANYLVDKFGTAQCKSEDGDSVSPEDQDNMRELKRKLQEQHNLASRRQSVQNRHNKKTRVSSTSPQPQAVLLEDKEVKSASKKGGCTRSKRKQDAKRNGADETTTPIGKVAIPRLAKSPAILVVQSPSPTTINKPKFVPIQPKPHGENGSLPQLKEEDHVSELVESPWGEGTCHDDELAQYLPQPGESITDSLSPKVPNAELSQLRVLLEQTEAAKKKPVGLLERRNVRFETPSGLNDAASGVGNGNVPPSPNTRRRQFNFTPISPRLTPDVVPPSPGSAGQLRQLLSTSSGVNSPFISPRQTPSSLPSSQPHSRHNSGHMMNMDTPTSIVTEASSVSNDSAFVSPLNTPLSVSRSRHNSASNLLVNRARHSSGASITVRHMPYTTTPSHHGPESLLNVSARSRHSSAGSPSLPRSAPLSPLVQSFPQQTSESNFGQDRFRQDLRRRHVSAGVVLGLNRQIVGRAQTTLNSTAPLWGCDPLAQEIAGLLDSAPSNVNDSMLNRSQSVPLHQMFQQFQSQVGSSQSNASLSQPSTPFGCGRPFTFNSSAASSPYSCTATPVPAEWTDFNSHANSVDSGAEAFGQHQDLDNFNEIISEVYANNQEGLATCLAHIDGLGNETLQHSTSATFAQINFQGTNTGMINMDSDPSLSCSDTGDGYPLSDLSDSVPMPGMLGAEDLAATLVALKEAPELNRLVQDVVDGHAVPQGM